MARIKHIVERVTGKPVIEVHRAAAGHQFAEEAFVSGECRR